MFYKSYYVYIVVCKDDNFYTGQTGNIRMRLNQHNGVSYWPGAKYTKSRRPVFLQHLEKFQTRKDAMARENEIKQMPHTEKRDLIDKTSKDQILSAV